MKWIQLCGGELTYVRTNVPCFPHILLPLSIWTKLLGAFGWLVD